MRRRRTVIALLCAAVAAAFVAAVLATGTGIVSTSQTPANAQSSALATNPVLDPGTPLSGSAPDFTLRDQFGKSVSLRSLRGKVVLLAFNDPQCTTMCPLTTTAMVDVKALLGAAGSGVQLLGIDTNPAATSVHDVLAYSQVHAMTHDWHFLTGSLAQLKRVWRAYHIYVQVINGQVDHNPAVYMIDRHGRLAKIYFQQMAYRGIDQQAQIFAREASRLLPGPPPVRSRASYGTISAIAPSTSAAVPRAGGGVLQLRDRKSPHLFLFFDTWDREVTDIGTQLTALNRYSARARMAGLPALTAIDEQSVEPTASALPRFLRSLRGPLSFPVALDSTGRVADGYEVQDQPWFVLVSSSGHILWYYDVSTQGWLGTSALITQVRAALLGSGAAPTATDVQSTLNGSPAPLAAIHRQAGELLGSQSELARRLRALHGYPVVLNAWASWCAPCQQEFPLFASAAQSFGSRIAFLGVDTDDSSSSDARSFLARHPVSYPSYQSTSAALSSIVAIEGLPTTIYLDSQGSVAYVHIGVYDSAGTLDHDIQRYALGN